MISGIQIALKNAIDVVSDNPDKFRCLLDFILAYATACSSFIRSKKHVRFCFFFFFSLQNIVNNAKIFKALFIDRARIYFLRVIYDDFSSFKCHTPLHVPLYLFTFYLYRSVCRAFGHRGQYDTVRYCEFFSSHLACAHGRFKWRSFGADKKTQTNRDIAVFGWPTVARETYSFRLERVSTLSNDSNMCVIFSILYNYFKLHLRTVDRISLICAHLIIYRVLHIIYFSSKMIWMT